MKQHRWKHLIEVERNGDAIPGVTGTTLHRLVQFASDIRRLTGLRTAFNTMSGSLFFYYQPGDGDVVGVWTEEFRRSDTTIVPVWSKLHKIVNTIFMGRIKQRIKDREIAQQENDVKYQQKKLLEKHHEDVRPSAIDKIEYMQDREGMAKRSSRSALIDKKP